MGETIVISVIEPGIDDGSDDGVAVGVCHADIVAVCGALWHPRVVPSISPADIARVEAWATSSFPDRPDGARVVVQARGAHVNVEEQRPRRGGGVAARALVRFRFVEKTGTWLVHRAASGGRWIETEPLEGTLAEVLDGVDLRNLPRSP